MVKDPRDHKLHAARYTFHKVTAKRYGDQVASGMMALDEAAEMYRLAMANYDEIIEAAAGGALTDADEADMQKGFRL